MSHAFARASAREERERERGRIRKRNRKRVKEALAQIPATKSLSAWLKQVFLILESD